MSEPKAIVKLHDVVDLALGTPEVGTANFNILNNFLHIVLNQLNIGNAQIPLKDVQSGEIQSMPLSKADKGVGTKGSTGSGTTPKSIDENDRLQTLETKVSQMEEQFGELANISPNQDLINHARTRKESTPISDMWSIILLSKRMDAAELGVTKLTSLLEDLVKGHTDLKGINTQDFGDLTEFIDVIKAMEKRLWNVEMNLGIPTTAPQGQVKGDMTDHQKLTAMEDQLNRLSANVQQFATLTEAISMESLLEGVREMDTLRKKLERLTDFGVGTDPTKISEFEGKMCDLQLSYSSQMENVQGLMFAMEKEMGELMEKVNSLIPDGDCQPSQNTSGLAELYWKIDKLQEDVDNINSFADEYTGDREERKHGMETLFEQIEMLKLVKANREDLEDALADKADYKMMNKKVSHDQFDAVYDDLSQGLQEASNRLKEQEALWQQALYEIQKEMESKLDKVEISPLRDFINHKLKSIQTKLKALAEFHKDPKAAASKKQVLRNVNCLSCDKDVVMITELDEAVPEFPKWPPAKSMKPYLTYEMGELEQQHKRLLHGKNLLYLQEIGNEKKMEKIRWTQDEDEGEGHICTRYCNGSTSNPTTPNQRVSHLGHFLPECTISDPKNKTLKISNTQL